MKLHRKTDDTALERKPVEANVATSRSWLEHQLKSWFRTSRATTGMVSSTFETSPATALDLT